jgi:ABC-type uncharacterized transport system permease subunit
MTGTLLTCAAACLAVATAIYYVGLLGTSGSVPKTAHALTVIALGVLAAAGIVEIASGTPQLAMGPQILLFVSLGATLATGALPAIRSSRVLPTVIASLLTAVAFALAVKSIRGDLPSPETADMGAVTVIHIGATLLGFLLYLPAFVFAVLFLQQQDRIKSKQLGGGFGSLVGLERHAYRLLGFGFPLYSIGILLGFVWQERQLDASSVRPEHVVAALSWCIYAMIATRHFRSGWRGKPAAIANIGAFSSTLGAVLLYVMR